VSSSTGCGTTSCPVATEGGDAVAYVSGQTAAFKDIAERIMERLADLPALHHRRHLPRARDGVPVDRDLADGGDHDHPLGVCRLRRPDAGGAGGPPLGLTGLDRTGPIETFVPPIAFAILFGLSMDYMVFLMSRIREEHVHGLNTRDAVEHGIARSGG
jgi:RND superfamily putative drug exporter